MTQKKYLNSLNLQSSETKPNTKLVLKLCESKESSLCLEFNKPNKLKQNVCDISLCKKFNLSQSQK